MFDNIAGRYDLMNDLLSLFQDRRWRRAVTRAVVTRPGLKVLDVAAGTGTSTAALAAAGAEAIAADFSQGMIAEGRRRYPHLQFDFADATALPYADATFDAVTISFGLRNVNQPDAALREFLRVLKPGGHVVICEFSRPTWAPFRALYRFWLGTVLPFLGRLMTSDPAAYAYLTDSILNWPAQREFAQQLRQTGFERVAWQNQTGGIVALHRGLKPRA